MKAVFVQLCILLHASSSFATNVMKESPEKIAATIMESFDTNKDGKISLAEVKEHLGGDPARAKSWEKALTTADTDKDGHLSSEELVYLVTHSTKQVQEQIVNDSEESIAATIMDGFDSDKDGKLSLKELMDHIGDKQDVHSQFQGWQTGFKDADADKDEHLTVHELASLLKNTMSHQEQHKLLQESETSMAAYVMDGIDDDKDGKLSLMELVTHIGKNAKLAQHFQGWESGFKQADANGDQHLTIEELAELLNHLNRQTQHDLVEESEKTIGEHIMTGFDSDRDGKISLKELMDHVGDDKNLHASFKGWQAGFKQADADNDGLLSPEEVTNLIAHVSRQDQHNLVEQSEKSIGESIMTGFDTDKNGKISLEELMAHIGDKKDVHSTYEGWQTGFREADKDNDGQLSATELQSLLQHVSDQEQKRLADEGWKNTMSKLMKQYDSDKDGKVSLKEMKTHMDKPSPLQVTEGWQDDFKLADADKDGYLSAEELQDFFTHVSRAFQRALVADEEKSLLQKMMSAFDDNSDGKVTLEELMKQISRKTEVQALKEGWELGFKDADVNKDGHLVAEEVGSLMAAVSKYHRRKLTQESEAAADSVVTSYDTDKDGKINYKELEGKEAGFVVTEFKGWQAGFHDCDGDHNGYLTKQELSSWFKRMIRPRHEEM